MSKKYLSLEEAAAALNLPTSDLMRMREQGEIRGFADRGNWKFKSDDVEALARTRNADSNPDIPLLAEDEDEVGEQPTVISKSSPSEEAAGDVDDSLFDDSDSDVKLVGLDSAAELISSQGKTDPDVDLLDSDSDVRLSADDSDSDVRLAADDSDSDVSLMDSATISSFDMNEGEGSDSDVQLVSDDKDESDVTLMSGGEQEAQPVQVEDDDSVFSDESGISLAEDSSLLLGGESGINLEGPTDSGIELTADDDDEGITLDLGDDSGISLEMDESGISLESDDDSGISLEADDQSGTIPMMGVLDDDNVPETQYEIPPLDEDDSEVFNISDADDTGVLDMSELEDSQDDAVFDVDDDDDEFGASDEFESFDDDDDLDLEADAFDDDDDLEVFDADDDVFDDDVDSDYASRPRGGVAAAESDWGMGMFIGLTFSSLLLLICCVVMIDLVGNMSTASSPNPLSGAILEALGGLYGS